MSDTEREAMDKDLDIDEEQSKDVAGGISPAVEAQAAAAPREKRVAVEQPPL
jgi:hypothetical protein